MNVAPEKLPEPQGIGMAVAFDWGLAVQILVTPFLSHVLGIPGYLSSLKQFNFSPSVMTLISFALSVPFAAGCWLVGEGLRCGWRWTRPLQAVGNALLVLGGFVSLFNLWRGSRVGNYWSLVPVIILLVFSPLIAWRLSRLATKQWFVTVSSAEARKRHAGVWPWLILLWAIVGGVLESLSSFYIRIR
jgi:hypothetical protein